MVDLYTDKSSPNIACWMLHILATPVHSCKLADSRGKRSKAIFKSLFRMYQDQAFIRIDDTFSFLIALQQPESFDGRGDCNYSGIHAVKPVKYQCVVYR